MSGAPSPTEQSRTAFDPFPWSEASAEAAVLLAEDRLTDAAIAKKVGVGRTTLHTWKLHPEFAAKVTALYNELIERARRRGLARLDRRMDAYTERHRRMTKLMKDRGRQMAGKAPGADTGLLVRQFKSVGSGEAAYTVEEYHFDAALMRELRELEKQVAQDTGQWSEKREVSGPDGGALTVVLAERTDGPQ